MPKIKTHRATKKRVKLTANGKVKKNSPFCSHLMSSKTTKRKRNLRKSSILAKADTKRIKRLLGV